MTILERWMGVMERRDRRARRFGVMMETFGVFDRDRSFSTVDAVAIEGAARRCLACTAVEQCEAWSRGRRDLSEAAGFCPNAEFFRNFGRRLSS